MSATRDVPRVPRALAGAMTALPLLPLSMGLTRLAGRMAHTHPQLLRRLGSAGSRRFLIDPTDLPCLFLLDLSSGRPRITAMRRRGSGADCRISGPLAALLGLVHGAYDGDALFFSRDLTIEGDTSAIVALRNAMDDAELDLAREIAAVLGPLEMPALRALAAAERLTGVALHRVEGEPA